MVTKQDIVNTFPTSGEYVNNYDTLQKFKRTHIKMRLMTTVELVDERDLRYEITLSQIINNKRFSLLDLKPLLYDGWCYDSERECLFLPLS